MLERQRQRRLVSQGDEEGEQLLLLDHLVKTGAFDEEGVVTFNESTKVSTVQKI
jgi:hypothetical protein